MSLFDAICNKINYSISRNKQQTYYYTRYNNIGSALMCIWNNSNKSYMDKYLEYSEVVSCMSMSTYSQYVYQLKLTRELDKDECFTLSRFLIKAFADYFKISVSDFVKRYDIRVSGTNLFVVFK